MRWCASDLTRTLEALENTLFVSPPPSSLLDPSENDAFSAFPSPLLPPASPPVPPLPKTRVESTLSVPPPLRVEEEEAETVEKGSSSLSPTPTTASTSTAEEEAKGPSAGTPITPSKNGVWQQCQAIGAARRREMEQWAVKERQWWTILQQWEEEAEARRRRRVEVDFPTTATDVPPRVVAVPFTHIAVEVIWHDAALPVESIPSASVHQKRKETPLCPTGRVGDETNANLPWRGEGKGKKTSGRWHRPAFRLALSIVPPSSSWGGAPTPTPLPMTQTGRGGGLCGQAKAEVLRELQWVLSAVEKGHARRLRQRWEEEGDPLHGHDACAAALSSVDAFSTGQRGGRAEAEASRVLPFSVALDESRGSFLPMEVILPSVLFPLFFDASLLPSSSSSSAFSFLSSLSALSTRLVSWVGCTPTSTSSSSLSSSFREETLRTHQVEWCHTLIHRCPHLSFYVAPNPSSPLEKIGEAESEAKVFFWKRKSIPLFLLFGVCLWMVYRCVTCRKDWNMCAVEKEDDV